MSRGPYPQPFMFESDGAWYDAVEIHDLEISPAERHKLLLQALAWVIEALKVDARRDTRWTEEEQINVAAFLCLGREDLIVKQGAWEEWQRTHEGSTYEEFEAQFDIDEHDDSVRQFELPEWWFLIYEHGTPWATENVLGAPGFKGLFYLWNIRTVEDSPPGVWLTSPNPMLCASTETENLDWWISAFASLMHTMLCHEFSLSGDERVLWLKAWQFPTFRPWLGWRLPEHSSFVADLKQQLITLGLELLDPVLVTEERIQLQVSGGDTRTATRRLKHHPDSW